MDKDKIFQCQLVNFIMNSVDNEISEFHNCFNKFLENFNNNDYSSAKSILSDMELSIFNIFGALSVFDQEQLFFHRYNFNDHIDTEYYKEKIMDNVIQTCIADIENNLDIFNEPFKPDYYYLSEQNIKQRKLDKEYTKSNNIDFYYKCILLYIKEASILCGRHLLLTDLENGNG